MNDWLPIAATDPLLSPPDQPTPLGADPLPTQLPTHEMAWESFERLIVQMARREGARDVRLYGTRGQSQDGIDVVGFFAERERPTVYQAKRTRTFQASDLEAAVNRYLEGDRPIDTDRIVVAVASEAHDTETIQALADIRRSHPDIEIEFWDRDEISDRLRSEPGLVERFFGRDAAVRFCGALAGLRSASIGPVSADAILRGPIRHLGLQVALDDAEAAVGANHHDAAAAQFAAIAGALEQSPYAAHAEAVRRQEAKALEAAGRLDEAAAVLLQRGWSQFAAGSAHAALSEAKRLTELTGLGGGYVRASTALTAAAACRHVYVNDLSPLAQAFDELQPDDPFRADAAVALAEEANAWRATDLIIERRPALEEIAAAQRADDNGMRIAARIRMCVADATDGWAALASEARTLYPASLMAWIAARHARHLLLTGKLELAADRWTEASELACSANLYDDAADCLYSRRDAELLQGLLPTGGDESHQLAQTLRASGSGSNLSEPFSLRESALAYLRDERWPDALETLKQYLWRSVALGDWQAEREAHRQLGHLFKSTDRAQHAIPHFVAAGDGKTLKELARSLPESPLRIPPESLTDVPWERAAAFNFVAEAADLLDDEDAATWSQLAIDTITAGWRPVSMFTADPFLAAFTAFARLSPAASDAAVSSFLDRFESLIQRPIGQGLHTDEAHVDALIRIATSHDALRARAVDQLVRIFLTGAHEASALLQRGSELWVEAAESAQQALEERVQAGDMNAALLLVLGEASSDPLESFATERVEIASRPRDRRPGVRSFGTGMVHVARLATVLQQEQQDAFARAALDLARDSEEPAINRREALGAIVVVSDGISDNCRTELFDECLRLAAGPTEEDPEEFPGALDLLSRFRVDMGSVDLQPDALTAAAALSRQPEDRQRLEQVGRVLLYQGTDDATRGYAHAIGFFPVDELRLDVPTLAGHPSKWIRALAASIVSRAAEPDVTLAEQLARDSSPLVRRQLITHHDEARPAEAAVAVLRNDPRRSIRLAARRVG